MQFEWDQKKAKFNRIKHGISFEEAVLVFGDPLSVTVHDPAHSKLEDRYVTMGITSTNELLVVVHFDHNDTIRIISARQATKQERRNYEQGYH
jgi:hypothetical protein